MKMEKNEHKIVYLVSVILSVLSIVAGLKFEESILFLGSILLDVVAINSNFKMY